MTIDLHDTKKDTYWEKIARTKWGSYITDVEKRVLLKAVSLSQEPDTALEIGCEGGRWAKFLVDRGWRVTCTDIKSDAIEICKKRIPTATCVLVSPQDRTLPCEPSSQTLLLCIEVMPVLGSDWFASEALRVLRPGGLFVGVFLNRRSFRGYYRHLTATKNKEFDYYKVDYPNWRSRLCNHGFQMIVEEGICWFPFTRDSNSSLIPILTQLELRLGLRRLPGVSPWIVFLAQKG